MQLTCFILLLLFMFSIESIAQCNRIESRDADDRISARNEVNRQPEIAKLPSKLKFLGSDKKVKYITGIAYPSGFFVNTGFSEGLGKITIKGKNGFINS